MQILSDLLITVGLEDSPRAKAGEVIGIECGSRELNFAPQDRKLFASGANIVRYDQQSFKKSSDESMIRDGLAVREIIYSLY